MVNDNRRATVHYRKLARDQEAFPKEKTLSQALGNALESKDPSGVRYKQNWRLRVTEAPSGLNQLRFINDIHVDNESVFGNLCAYSQDAMQSLIDLQESNANAKGGTGREIDNVGISETKAPNGTEYLHGMAYWLVVGDHCYIVQHTAVQTKAFEEYLTWLLRDKARVIGQEQFVMLKAVFDLASVGGDLGNVRAIEIGGLAPETIKDRGQGIRPSSETGSTKLVEKRRSLRDLGTSFSKGMKIVEEILGSAGAKTIRDSVPQEAALDVRVNIGYRATRREIDRHFMNDLAKGLRNVEDGEVRIRANDRTIKGDDARLSETMPFKLLRPNGSLLDLEDARSQLREVHRRFLADGKITD